MLVENSNSYTINAISRDAAGEYKCSLADNEKLEASHNIVVNCEYLLTKTHTIPHQSIADARVTLDTSAGTRTVKLRNS